MNNNTIKIEIENSIDKTESDDKSDDNIEKIDFVNIDNPHNGERITEMEMSPNEKYLVTYSEDDHSIFGWSIEDEGPPKPKFFDKLNFEDCKSLHQIIISDDKKLAYFNNYEYLEIYDINRKQKIKLDCGDNYNCHCYTFNLEGDFILHEAKDNIIYIYSTQTTKNNKWNCKRMYKIPVDFNIINISKYNKLYLFSNNSIFEHNLITKKSLRIIKNDEKIKSISYSKKIRISSNKELIYVKINNKVVVYSIKFEIPFASLDINNDTQLHNFICRTRLISLLIPLLSGSIIEELWQIKSLPDKIRTTTKYVFGIQGGHILKIKHEDILAKMDLKFEIPKIPDEIIDHCWYFDNKNPNKTIEDWYFEDAFKTSKETYKTNDFSNIHFINAYMEIIHALFQDMDYIKNEVTLGQKLIAWNIKTDKEIIELNVCRVKTRKKDKTRYIIYNLICKRVENINADQYIFGIKALNNNDIILLTTKGLFIYHFNENSKSISLNYYYYMKINISHDSNREISNKDDIINQLKNYKNKFLESTLPLSDYHSLKHYDKWVSYIKDDKERLLKYGVELLTFAIEEHNLDLIEDIYKKCMNYFEKDLKNNRMFLSIIASTMPLLNKYYPDYISRYSSETTMITDSSFYNIEYTNNNNLHLHSYFQYPQIINLTRSIWWCKYRTLMSEFGDNYKIMYLMLITIQILIILPFLFIYIAILCILLIYYYIIKVKEEIFNYTMTTPTIIFMNPYIKFVNYPQEYNWFWELIKPKSSPFVETISKDIYKTWNGEALINFKWNNYGKYYYTLIWIGYMAFLGCFTIAATISQQYISDDTQNRLLIASIILGFIHLSFEIRQFIYDPIKWIHNFWNIFDLKFLLFFRVFESFGIYFAIMISVGKQIASFLVVLFIIIISFAHTFYILLSPKFDFSFKNNTNNDDPNNPWNIASAYYQVFEGGTVNRSQYMIQLPDGNTNMFVDFGTALFAMYLFLTGDSSALSKWTYKDNPSLVILIVLFSLLIVVYLMNLLIGLLNNAIEKDNNKTSYLVQKAEILAEIELLYLLPHQRRWHTWFPEVIYYYADADKVRQEIKEMLSKGEWNTDEFCELKQDLLNQLKIHHNPVDETTLKNILEEIRDLRSRLPPVES
ncbi:hypothetical protein RhiirA1_389068 [Rhizophagus irregularis]|uniref:Ion transport domain-containing protein n=1 Tax=Rhizophagus irregularis TaxID=588596 RepID=A0A2N0SCG7_9GLOM|nr:hypothetical protein RhiirA1_389068 [Rhizophagus irregularis]